jgi:hypothetical protein
VTDLADREGLPRPDPELVAAAVEALAVDVRDGNVRAQLHALAGIVRSLAPPTRPTGSKEALDDLRRAHASGDDGVVATALARFAAAEQRIAPRVDWEAASGG